jgi:hypothetical protein
MSRPVDELFVIVPLMLVPVAVATYPTRPAPVKLTVVGTDIEALATLRLMRETLLAVWAPWMVTPEPAPPEIDRMFRARLAVAAASIKFRFTPAERLMSPLRFLVVPLASV